MFRETSPSADYFGHVLSAPPDPGPSNLRQSSQRGRCNGVVQLMGPRLGFKPTTLNTYGVLRILSARQKLGDTTNEIYWTWGTVWRLKVALIINQSFGCCGWANAVYQTKRAPVPKAQNKHHKCRHPAVSRVSDRNSHNMIIYNMYVYIYIHIHLTFLPVSRPASL